MSKMDLPILILLLLAAISQANAAQSYSVREGLRSHFVTAQPVLNFTSTDESWLINLSPEKDGLHIWSNPNAGTSKIIAYTEQHKYEFDVITSDNRHDSLIQMRPVESASKKLLTNNDTRIANAETGYTKILAESDHGKNDPKPRISRSAATSKNTSSDLSPYTSRDCAGTISLTKGFLLSAIVKGYLADCGRESLWNVEHKGEIIDYILQETVALDLEQGIKTLGSALANWYRIDTQNVKGKTIFKLKR